MLGEMLVAAERKGGADGDGVSGGETGDLDKGAGPEAMVDEMRAVTARLVNADALAECGRSETAAVERDVATAETGRDGATEEARAAREGVARSGVREREASEREVAAALCVVRAERVE